MKLCYLVQRNKLTAQLYTNEDHFIHGCEEKISPILPAFKSGDQWVADIGEEKTALAIVSVWVDPETGVIHVTPFGSMRRRPFTLVKRWILQLVEVGK